MLLPASDAAEGPDSSSVGETAGGSPSFLRDSFCRVSLGEAVALWKLLWDTQEREALQAAMGKFLVVPFRAETMADVDSLLGLVQLHREMAEG